MKKRYFVLAGITLLASVVATKRKRKDSFNCNISE